MKRIQHESGFSIEERLVPVLDRGSVQYSRQGDDPVADLYNVDIQVERQIWLVWPGLEGRGFPSFNQMMDAAYEAFRRFDCQEHEMFWVGLTPRYGDRFRGIEFR